MHFAPYQYQPAALQAVRCDYVIIAQWVMQQLPKHYQYEHFGSIVKGVYGKAKSAFVKRILAEMN